MKDRRDYYGKDKVISRYRLGTAINELNEQLNKSKQLLKKVRDGNIDIRSHQIIDLLWYIEQVQEEYDLKEEV